MVTIININYLIFYAASKPEIFDIFGFCDPAKNRKSVFQTSIKIRKIKLYRNAFIN